MKIYFIRHGKTLWNVEERYIGRTDLPLCQAGIEELQKKWGKSSIKFDYLYSSPMKRCVETAKILFPEADIKTESNLRERDFGIFEGKRYGDLKDDINFIKFVESKGTFPIPDGESREDFEKRISAGVRNIISETEANGGQSLGLVTHGGVIMHLLSNLSVRGGTIFDYRVENGGGYMADYDKASGLFHLLGEL